MPVHFFDPNSLDDDELLDAFVSKLKQEAIAKFDPNQPRDWRGRWTTGGTIAGAKRLPLIDRAFAGVDDEEGYYIADEVFDVSQGVTEFEAQLTKYLNERGLPNVKVRFTGDFHNLTPEEFQEWVESYQAQMEGTVDQLVVLTELYPEAGAGLTELLLSDDTAHVGEYGRETGGYFAVDGYSKRRTLCMPMGNVGHWDEMVEDGWNRAQALEGLEDFPYPASNVAWTNDPAELFDDTVARGIVTHEFGHLVHSVLLEKLGEDTGDARTHWYYLEKGSMATGDYGTWVETHGIRSMYDEATNNYLYSRRGSDSKYVNNYFPSRYSQLNRAEYFAESFTVYAIYQTEQPQFSGFKHPGIHASVRHFHEDVQAYVSGEITYQEYTDRRMEYYANHSDYLADGENNELVKVGDVGSPVFMDTLENLLVRGVLAFLPRKPKVNQ